VRLGDVLQAAVIFAGTALHFSVRAFSVTTLAITVLWLVVAAQLYFEHKRRVPDSH
jgi:AAA family ATP:ADP antiporter